MSGKILVLPIFICLMSLGVICGTHNTIQGFPSAVRFVRYLFCVFVTAISISYYIKNNSNLNIIVV